ncbi:hypothetical protein FA95DRAFT_1564887 [Auriscalpium vulgare]|uniref:Uncharacterized protein n=1 Tax=Auriscalpium vulgare TaxID=40419 RepID=A0ACB8RCN7_9AGAM|nr:hypothetical protein FA95DRAFT_1564887 [Auriscalpium vulgare]
MRFLSFTGLATLAVLASFAHALPVPVDERTVGPSHVFFPPPHTYEADVPTPEELNVRQCPWMERSPRTKEENIDRRAAVTRSVDCWRMRGPKLL